MLHDDWLFNSIGKVFASLSWDTEGLKNVSIFSNNFMFLIDESAIFNLFLYSPVVCFRIREWLGQHVLLETVPNGGSSIIEISLELRVESIVKHEVCEDCD
jgi:hypothetical protein